MIQFNLLMENYLLMKKILKKKIKIKLIRCGNFNLETNTFIETLPNGLNI